MIWAIGIFGLTFVLSIAMFVVLIVALPPAYFLPHQHPFWHGRHPLIRLLGLIGKNALGVTLIILGIVLSVPGIPGQGLLTIVIGTLLLDIPGKHRLVRLFVCRRGVLRNLNRFRALFGRPPLIVENS